MARPTIQDVDFGFSIQGDGRPTRQDVNFGFVIKRPATTRSDIDFTFAVEGVEPTLFYWDGTKLTPGSQYVWVDGTWFPPL